MSVITSAPNQILGAPFGSGRGAAISVMVMDATLQLHHRTKRLTFQRTFKFPDAVPVAGTGCAPVVFAEIQLDGHQLGKHASAPFQ